jgi:hypothetical protein
MQGIHRKERENRKRKTLLTHTGLLMEGTVLNQVVTSPALDTRIKLRGSDSPGVSAAIANKLTKPKPLHWICKQVCGSAQKTLGVRQLCVTFKGNFVDPLGMNRKNQRFAQGFKHIYAQTARFCTRALTHTKQFLAEGFLFAGNRIKPDHRVNRHALTPAHKYAKRL